MKNEVESKHNDVMKHLCDTVALLGGKDDILNTITKWFQGKETDEVTIQQLMNWNMKKVDEIKNRLERTSKRSVTRTHFN
jgi:hypothetical protein